MHKPANEEGLLYKPAVTAKPPLQEQNFNHCTFIHLQLKIARKFSECMRCHNLCCQNKKHDRQQIELTLMAATVGYEDPNNLSQTSCRVVQKATARSCFGLYISRMSKPALNTVVAAWSTKNTTEIN
jgi:hypothetical protein